MFEDCLAAYRKATFKTFVVLFCPPWRPSGVPGCFTCFCSAGMRPVFTFTCTVCYIRGLFLFCTRQVTTKWVLLQSNSSGLPSYRPFTITAVILLLPWSQGWLGRGFLCRFVLIKQRWHGVCQSKSISTQRWIKAISVLFRSFFWSWVWQLRSELAELLRVPDGSQLMSLVSPQAELYSPCSAEQL